MRQSKIKSSELHLDLASVHQFQVVPLFDGFSLNETVEGQDNLAEEVVLADDVFVEAIDGQNVGGFGGEDEHLIPDGLEVSVDNFTLFLR